MRNYIIIFRRHDTNSFTFFVVHGIRLDRLSLALIHGPIFLHFLAVFDGAASYLKKLVSLTMQKSSDYW